MGFFKPLCFSLLFLSGFFFFTNGDVVSDVLSSMDQSVDRCQDFYQYACGGWIKNQTLAPDQSVVTKSFTSIEKINDEVLQAIINDSSHVHVHDFFQACMNVSLINSRGIAPIQPYLAIVNQIQSATDFARAVAVLHEIGFSTLFGFTVDIDPKNPPINIIQIQQGGLGLPDQSLYSVPSLVSSYQTHIYNMMMLAGQDPSTSQQIAQSVVQFETSLASFTVPNNNMTDPFGLYNPVDTKGLKSLCPSFDWHSYLLRLTGNDTYGTINVITPTFFSFLSPFLFNSSPTTLRNYLLWAVVHNAATLLTEKFGDENFAFYGKILGGLDKQPPRWRSCEQAVDGDLGDLLGVYFAKKAFGGESKDVAAKMVAAIEQAMTNRLQTISWMDDQTRAEGLKKISLVGNYIGYPDHLRNISFEITDDYFSNVKTSAVITTQQAVQKIGKAADKALWSMTADTINAYYDPTRNQMVFPAAILQTPYFDISRPAPLNFGGAGVIMGHELTHGFDNSGRDYDGYGKLRDWWQPDTSKQFDSRVQCVIDQYSKYEVLPGVFIDGKLTQGENVADMGGVKNSYDAYMSLYGPVANQPSVVPGLTNAQLLFVGYAQGWCALARPEYLKNQVKTDPHSWARFRVIGPLVNFPEFAQTFSCPAGSPMNPVDRCTVW